MPESPWSIKLSDLRKAVGYYCGYGRGALSAWSTEQLEDIDDFIDGGLRQFYQPPILPNEMRSHAWSFLKPVRTLTTTADDADIAMPDDVSSIIGDMTYASTVFSGSVRQVGEEALRMTQTGTDGSSGKPCVFCVRPDTAAGNIGQRWTITFHPTPDAAYVLTYKYNWMMPKLSDDRPFPVGGMIHSETIRQSCIAYAEYKKDSQRGLEYARFLERLAASVSFDRDLNPDTLGVISDNSDAQEFGMRTFEDSNGTTYNGVLYG